MLFLWFLIPLIFAQDFYKDNSNIFELTASSFNKVIYSSNYTTIVEFYAPWCGYCKQLKPVYEKVGRFIQADSKYAVNVAAINCDKSYNKQLCADHQITGFPTLKVFRPPKYDANKPKKSSKHVGEVFNGERGFKSMVNFLTSRIKNYVDKVKVSSLDSWIAQTGDFKLLLFTKNQSVSPLFKSLAVDFLGVADFGYVATKDLETINILGHDIQVQQLPSLYLINKNSGEVAKWDQGVDKTKITQWIILHGIDPVDGELSSKGKRLTKYRINKKKIVHDEL